MLGLSEQEWKELKEQRYEYNCRHSKIIEKMEQELEKKIKENKGSE